MATRALYAFLAALWAVHALEKFDVVWPPWLQGGTGDVLGMLALMRNETPFRAVEALIRHVLLPLGAVTYWGVAVTELAVAAAFAAGRYVLWGGLLGAGIQVFLWLGFWTSDWPTQYPLILALHLAAILQAAGGMYDTGSLRIAVRLVLRLAAAGLWLFEVARVGWLAGGLAALFLLGAGTPVAALAGIWLTWRAWPDAWGYWPWAYYAVVFAHLLLVVSPWLDPWGVGHWRDARRYRYVSSLPGR